VSAASTVYIGHCLHHVLPLHSSNSSQTTLRHRGHSYDAPRVNYDLTKLSFIMRSLYNQNSVLLYTSHRRPPEVCRLLTRPRTDVDSPRFISTVELLSAGGIVYPSGECAGLGAVGPGFKSQSRRCRVSLRSCLPTPVVPLFTKQRNW